MFIRDVTQLQQIETFLECRKNVCATWGEKGFWIYIQI